MNSDFDRIVLVDKPAGITSFGVVARVRRRLTEQAGRKIKVGHTGTLDPFATGLMILVTGKCTRDAEKFSKLDKVYEATFVLGAESSTGDPEGEITPFSQESAGNALCSAQTASRREVVAPTAATSRAADVFAEYKAPAAGEIRIPTRDEIENALRKFTGEISQRPPIFSAIKINGQRAYKLARKGVEVEIPARIVNVYELDLIDYDYPNVRIRAHVSSGTYIRSLAVDIGRELKTGAYVSELRRTKIADYDVKNAEKIEK